MLRFIHLFPALIVHSLVLARALCWGLPVLALGILFRSLPLAGPVSGRRWIAMLSFIEWDVSWQRPQQLASRLANDFDVVCCAPVRAHNAPWRSVKWLFRSREVLSDGLVVLRPLLL
ncbi:hypothetical protein HQ520_14990, partial [bacterium]|nr:hypothetical protein [bacterium]